MKNTRFARQIVALSFLLALPGRVFAQQAAEDSPAVLTSENANPDTDEVRRAGAEAWFRQNIEPSLTASRFQEASVEPSPVLYDANEVAPMPGKPIPERRTWTHRAQVGPVGAVLMAGDLPPTRAEWNDASDWNAPIRPEMFRFYFERVPPPKPPVCPVVQ